MFTHIDFKSFVESDPGGGAGGGGGGEGDWVPTMPGCVCPKVKDMGPFLASRE